MHRRPESPKTSDLHFERVTAIRVTEIFFNLLYEGKQTIRP
jgi:hypothetical protein